MTTAREEMLGAIRRALRNQGRSVGSSADPARPPEILTGEGGGEDSAGSEVPQDRLDLLESRISDYKATVLRCGPGSLSDTIGERLRSRGVESLVVPSDLPEGWISRVLRSEVELLKDGDPSTLSTAQLASMDAVVTGCAVAIPETGTLVLDGGPAQGRRAISLLPDYHLCVVLKGQVVGTLSEAISRLQRSQGAVPGPLTLISGPSATSDIELIRVEGVHGPRILDVILVDDH